MQADRRQTGGRNGDGKVKRFLIDANYGAYLEKMGISAEEVLKKAALPEDLFARQNPSLTTADYFRFMRAVDRLSPSRETPIRLAASEGIEAFSPPIFAAYCAPNALACLKRLAQYKPLIGALRYRVEERGDEVRVAIASADEMLEMPEILIGIEFAFIVGLIRKATKENISPLRASAVCTMQNSAYSEFLGVPVEKGETNSLVFARTDALTPFISQNESMWSFFEPELGRRLAMLEIDDSFAARVRSTLTELLPSGACTVEDAAGKLGCSKRTLQRKLQEEHTNFQKQLNHTRELLARNYLAHTAMTTEDIAFLLGYQECGSFVRAFSIWTGQTVGEYRERLKKKAEIEKEI